MSNALPVSTTPVVDKPTSDWRVIALLVLPWVQPYAFTPVVNIVPLLVSWGCAALLLMLGRWPSTREVAQAWALAALLSSFIGLVQYFGEAARFWLVHIPPELGLAMGNLRQRNQQATLLTLGVVAVLWWQSQGLRSRYALGMLAFLAIGSAATSSRTGLLQWLALPVLMFIWQRTDRKQPWAWRAWLWSAGVYVLASWLLPQLLAWWTGGQATNALARMVGEYGCHSRSVLWSNVLYLIGQRPWTGWGWDELKYAHYIADYPGERFCENLSNAHNLPLHLAVELGIPIAAVLMLGMLFLLVRARPWHLKNRADSLAWGVLMAIGLHSLLEYPLWYGPFQVATLGSVLLLWPRTVAWLQRQRIALRAVAAIGLGLVVLIGYDYQRARQVYLPSEQRVAQWRENPWENAQKTLFFREAVEFAALSLADVTPDNADAVFKYSQALLHYSPEPRVIFRLIGSARLLGRDDLAQLHTDKLYKIYGLQKQ